MADERATVPPLEGEAAKTGDAGLKASAALAGFCELPYELRRRILVDACSSGPASPRHTTVGRSSDCTATMLSLLRTARAFYPVIIPLLYAHVRITRPSTLRSFQQTLASRPSLGRLVSSLHIGADQALPHDWFPAYRSHSRSSDNEHFTLDLGGCHEDGRSWVRSWQYEIDLKEAKSSGSAKDCAYKALASAATDLDVDLVPQHQGYALSDQWLGLNAWVVRVMELKAAVELYYLEVQRLDDHMEQTPQEERPYQASDVYPRLKVLRSPRPAASAGKDVLYVTQSDILERLASSGSPTDCFNHPIIFARSGLNWIAQTLNDELSEEHGAQEDEGRGAEEIPDVFPQNNASADSTSLAEWDPLNLARSSTATVGGSLAVGSCLLSLTPHVRTLSLTGLFNTLIAGTRASCHQALGSLSLGPPSSDWAVPLQLNHTALHSVKKLRICGSILSDAEIACIAGANGALPQLTSLQWSMVEHYGAYDFDGTLLKVINGLLGVDLSKLGERDALAAAGRKRSRASFEDEASRSFHRDEEIEEAGEPGSSPRQLYIEAHLHPHDLEKVWWAVPTEEISEAVSEGSELPGILNRLRLDEHPDYIYDSTPAWASFEGMKGLYDEGRRWWEEA